jgi:hypothetical protein
MKSNSQSIKYWGIKLRKKSIKKQPKTKEITMKRMRVKFDIKLKWNQISTDAIEQKKPIKKMLQNKRNSN